MLILFIILYFAIVGVLFYKLFISSLSERELAKEPAVEPVQEIAKDLTQEPVLSKFTSNEAADLNVG